VRALAETPEGAVLAGARQGGVAIWEGERFRNLALDGPVTGPDVYALLVRRSGHLVVGTFDDGVRLCFAPRVGACRTVREGNGLPDDGVRSLFEDREGRLWIGTEGGLAHLVSEDYWSYGEPEGLPSRHVYALAPAADGGLWVGTVEGLAHLRVGAHGEPEVRIYGRADGLPGLWVWAVLVDRRRETWVGTNGGLCRLGPAGCQLFGTAEGLPASYVLSLAEDGNGAIWVGTTGGVGRIRCDPEGRVLGVDAFTPDDGLARERAYALAVDGAGRVWAAHVDRLSLYENGSFRAVGAADGLGWKTVRGLGLDAAGRLLVGGLGELARQEGGAGEPLRFRRWEREPRLSGSMVLALVEDDDGHLLLGTTAGLLVFDPEALSGRGSVLARLDARTGAAATEVTHSGAFARDAGGRFWVGFKGGVTAIHGELAPPPVAPTVVFSRLASERGRIFLEPFSGVARGPVGWLAGPPPELPHDDRSLRVSVRAASASPRADLRFQFLLQGVDEEWSEARAQPFRDLMNLPPGNYRLLARAGHVDGPWSAPAAIAFAIEAAWWQTSIFRLGALALLVATAVLAVSWRLRAARQAAADLERRIAERTDDLARYAAALADHLRTIDEANVRSRRGEAARRDLFARTSHELRTPLTAVLGFSELLERALGDRLDAKEKRYLANVRESGELLLRQVNELLEHLKLESGRVEIHLDDVGLGELLASVVSLMEGFALHRGVRIECRFADDLPIVRVDVAKLRQALMNLLSNAVKFSPAGESVEVSARALTLEDSPWRELAYEIAVRDRGPGVPPEEAETIFEPYRRLETLGAAPGTGLGLPIARQFVEILGGTLTLESEPGHGATFRALLPVDPDPVSPPAGRADSGGFEPQRVQLLVLDRDRGRFAALTQTVEAHDVLSVRVEGVEPLRRMLATLRPRALALPFDPAASDGPWDGVGEALNLVRNGHLPLVLAAVIGRRALALPFAGVLSVDVGEAELRRTLRNAGVSSRSVGRRPLVLVAAPRDAGVDMGAALSAAGCDHFRVEGAGAVRAALADAAPDAVVADIGHACALARELAARDDRPAGSAPGWILVETVEPTLEELNRLAEQTLLEGDPPERALAAALAQIVERSGTGLPAG
jgi:signal transduction histidine kinase